MTNYELELLEMLRSRKEPLKALIIAIGIITTELQRGGMGV